jgi:serine protease Do
MIRLVGAFSPGQSVNLDILRDGKREVVTVKLENQKKKPDKVLKKSFQDIDEPSLGLEVESLGDDKGIVVSRIFPGSTADEQGLRVGDHIEAINGRTVSKVIEFIEVLDSTLGGGKIHLLILRNKNKFHFELTQRS